MIEARRAYLIDERNVKGMPYSLEKKTEVDLRMYPRFTISKLTSECRGLGEEVCARNIVPEDYYFVENGEESPLINDFASTDGSGNKIVDNSPDSPAINLNTGGD